MLVVLCTVRRIADGRALVAQRVDHQGRLHLARRRLLAGADCRHLGDRAVRALVLVEVEG